MKKVAKSAAMRKPNVRLMEEYVAFATDKEPSTIASHTEGLRRWFWWLHKYGGKLLHTQARRYLYRQYELWLYAQGEKDYSVAEKIRAINALNKYIARYRKEDFPKFAASVKPYRLGGRPSRGKGGGGNRKKNTEASPNADKEA